MLSKRQLIHKIELKIIYKVKMVQIQQWSNLKNWDWLIRFSKQIGLNFASRLKSTHLIKYLILSGKKQFKYISIL